MQTNNHSRIPESLTNGVHANGATTTHSVNGNGTSAPLAPRPSLNGAAPHNRPDDITVKDLVEYAGQALLIVRAKWYWGLLAAVIIGGLGGFAIFRKPPPFTAETTLLAQNSLDKVISTQEVQPTDVQIRENSLRNHLSVMASRKFRLKLKNALTEDERKSIIAPFVQPGDTVDDEFWDQLFDRIINIDRERGREFFTIDVKHPNADVAMMLADRFTATYMASVQDEFRDANKAGFELLRKQAEALAEDIAKIEEQRLEFRKTHGIISRVDNQSLLTERLKRLDANLTDVRVKRVQLETQASAARTDRAKSEFPWDNPYLASFANNELLRQQLDQQVAQRSVLAGRYGPNHTKMREVEALIQGIRDSIKRNFDVAVHDLESQLDEMVKTEKQLQAEFDAAFASSIEIEKLASRYEILGTDVDAKRDTLAQLQKRIGAAGLSSQLPTDFMQVVDQAFIVKHHIPRQLIYMFFVGVIAVGSFFVTPLAVNLLDERVKGTTDLEAVLGRPLLGAIPTLRFREEDRAHVVRDRTDIPCSEAFVGVSAQLDLLSPNGYPKCVLVTSTLPGEGKSTVASNLAAAYTQLGKKVVILDLDLRRPSQQRLHGVVGEGGFLPWIRGEYTTENMVKADTPLGLRVLPDGTHLIPAGGDEAQPSHFLISKRLVALIQELKKHYDVVLIDTPPGGVFQDAVVLARHAQERVLIARDQKAPVEQVKKLIADFDKAGTSFTGTIVNGFNPSVAHKKIAYGYHKDGYGYHKKPKTKAKKPVAVK